MRALISMRRGPFDVLFISTLYTPECRPARRQHWCAPAMSAFTSSFGFTDGITADDSLNSGRRVGPLSVTMAPSSSPLYMTMSTSCSVPSRYSMRNIELSNERPDASEPMSCVSASRICVNSRFACSTVCTNTTPMPHMPCVFLSTAGSVSGASGPSSAASMSASDLTTAVRAMNKRGAGTTPVPSSAGDSSRRASLNLSLATSCLSGSLPCLPSRRARCEPTTTHGS
mmetsp:Transcript_18537/g.45627  ORF Transcript_18537/g.45627 Transcript_18537/m.45627 type:complete len:228 (+) Transcript_18537:556-1239(+)